MITICIPSTGEHHQLEEQVRQVTDNYLIGSYGDAGTTRRELIKQVKTDWILFIDADIIFEESDWYEKITALMKVNTAVFAKTRWSGLDIIGAAYDCQVCLVERDQAIFDPYLGTMRGYVGADGESEDFVVQLQQREVQFVLADTIAGHTHKNAMEFARTDRAKLGRIYKYLSTFKAHSEFFSKVQRFPCDPNNPDNLASGYLFEDCYRYVCDMAGIPVPRKEM